MSFSKGCRPGCPYCHRLFQRNPESDEEFLEQQYQLTKDIHLAIRLNQLRLSRGQRPVDVEFDLESLKQYLAMTKSLAIYFRPAFPDLNEAELRELVSDFIPGKGLQFPGFEIKNKPIIRFQEVAKAVAAVGYMGLLVTENRPRRSAQQREFEEETGLELRPPATTTLFLLPKAILHPSDDPINPSILGRKDKIIADMWSRYEDPLTLVDPKRRRGAYPVKYLLIQHPDQQFIGNKLQYTEDNYFVTQYIVPYEERDGKPPGLASGYREHGTYDMRLLEAQITYLAKLLRVYDDSYTYELINE